MFFCCTFCVQKSKRQENKTMLPWIRLMPRNPRSARFEPPELMAKPTTIQKIQRSDWSLKDHKDRLEQVRHHPWTNQHVPNNRAKNLALKKWIWGLHSKPAWSSPQSIWLVPTKEDTTSSPTKAYLFRNWVWLMANTGMIGKSSMKRISLRSHMGQSSHDPVCTDVKQALLASEVCRYHLHCSGSLLVENPARMQWIRQQSCPPPQTIATRMAITHVCHNPFFTFMWMFTEIVFIQTPGRNIILRKRQIENTKGDRREKCHKRAKAEPHFGIHAGRWA